MITNQCHFLHSNISIGTLIRKQAFHTRLSRIFHPCSLVPHFPARNFRPCISDRPAFSGLAFSVAPKSLTSCSPLLQPQIRFTILALYNFYVCRPIYVCVYVCMYVGLCICTGRI